MHIRDNAKFHTTSYTGSPCCSMLRPWYVYPCWLSTPVTALAHSPPGRPMLGTWVTRRKDRVTCRRMGIADPAPDCYTAHGCEPTGTEVCDTMRENTMPTRRDFFKDMAGAMAGIVFVGCGLMEAEAQPQSG